MAKVEIRKHSWLNFATLYDFTGEQGVSGTSTDTIAFWSVPEFPEIVPQDQDTFIQIDDQYLGRLDLIAYDAYGDADLWWVLAIANNYDLIPTDMIINSTIRIPNKDYIDSLLGKGQRQ